MLFYVGLFPNSPFKFIKIIKILYTSIYLQNFIKYIIQILRLFLFQIIIPALTLFLLNHILFLIFISYIMHSGCINLPPNLVQATEYKPPYDPGLYFLSTLWASVPILVVRAVVVN